MSHTSKRCVRPHHSPHRRPALCVEALESRNLLSVFIPAQIQHAYGFDQVPYDGSRQTIAIVDAYDDPSIASEVSTFSNTFGLPPANLIKATPQGMPVGNRGWAQEIALDVEWAHAIAPKATILLVEARSASLADLLGAVDYARNYPGVSAVSMSWGAGEFSSETLYDDYFTTPADHTGVTFVASSGDSGAYYGVSWPSSSANVVSVGGTGLTVSSSSGTFSSESGWSGSGGGYSNYVPEPSYQLSVQGSGARTNPDVSFDSNPNTGYYVYLSSGGRGWYQFGGTSAAAPQWAALVALANQARGDAGLDPLDGATQTLPALYSMPAGNFRDVTRGSNGYSARIGYD